VQVTNPQTITGKPMKRGKHQLVRIKCPHCDNQHDLHEGLRVPPCGSDCAEYYVTGQTLIERP
jgi:hypothetical protein